jgi:hypothetical protein
VNAPRHGAENECCNALVLKTGFQIQNQRKPIDSRGQTADLKMNVIESHVASQGN